MRVNTYASPLPGAWIVDPKDKGRKSIKLGNKIYLKNGSEFSIELHNPTQKSILTKIKINGSEASESGLVLRPGERFYLDCFLPSKKKFIFNTYDIENTSENLNAIANNGTVEISFYDEKIIPDWIVPNYYKCWPYNSNYWTFGSETITYGSTENLKSSINSNLDPSFSSLNSPSGCYNSQVLSIETGRVEGGDQSSQTFSYVNMDFCSFPIKGITYQILPESLMPIETKDISKKFCTECGRKAKPTFKFCPDCGNSIQ